MSHAQRFMDLFSGMSEAYGTYIIDENSTTDKGKKQGKAFTRRDPLTVGHWKKHLEGKESVGVIPIKKDNTCVWGAVDIDDYALDIETLARKIYKKKLPFFPLRSKSGGCHMAVFLSEPIPARDLQKKLTELAGYIGFGRSEIFPKQSTVLVEKGDLGNWLNMPYYGGDDSSRYCLDQNGEAMGAAVFLAAAERGRITPKELMALSFTPEKSALSNGPPCLEALCDQGFPQGTRNNGLFALGVYCRKAFPDSWETKLEEFNQLFMDPPLDSKEVQTINKQVGKKDYFYKCKDQPLASFCNAPSCRVREFGVGGSAMPSMTALRKIPTDQPVWFLQVNDTTFELSTEQLQNQAKFQKMCMEMINVMPPKMTEKSWQGIVQELLDKCVALDKPPEASIHDQFMDLLTVFLTDSRIKANSREEILLGRPWTGMHPEDETDTVVFFRLKDMEEFLHRNNFKFYTRSQIVSKMTTGDMNAKHHYFNIKGRGANVWYMNEPDEQTEKFDLPEMVGDVL